MKHISMREKSPLLIILTNILLGAGIIHFTIPGLIFTGSELIISALIVTGLYLFCRSGVGNSFLKRCLGLQEFDFIEEFDTDAEKEDFYQADQYVRMVFDQCLSCSKAMDNNLNNNIKLKYLKQDGFNAIAFWGNTIYLTRGLMQMPADFLSAVLMHEFGHISDRGARWEKGLIVGELYMLFLRWFSVFVLIVTMIMSGGILKNMITLLMINLVLIAWNQIRKASLKGYYKRCEFRADEFAVKAGLGKKLGAALMMIENLNAGIEMPIGHFAFEDNADVKERMENIVACIRQF